MKHREPHALALVEVIVSTAILGGLIAAVLTAVAAAATTRARVVERVQGAALAEALMAEILAQPCTDPGTPQGGLIQGSLNVLGITVTVTSSGGAASRASFDSIDDYDGWVCSPPLDHTDAPLAAFKGWTQRVSVDDVPPADPAGADAGVSTGLKRITVLITRDGREVARHVALRSVAWEEALDAR